MDLPSSGPVEPRAAASPPPLPGKEGGAARGAAAPGGGGSTLTPEQLTQIAAARQLGGKVRFATGVAKADGWTIGIFGALTLLLGFGDVPSMLLGAAMAALGVLQLRAARELEALRSESVRRLAAHQVILGVLIVGYALLSVWMARNEAHPLSSLFSDPQLSQMLEPYEGMTRQLYIGFYLLVAVVGALGCGATALYYSTRAKYVARYRDQTPAWILDLARAGMRL